TLIQLGILYDQAFGRLEETALFFRKAADKSSEIHAVGKEIAARTNLAEVLRKLRRFDEARKEIRKAIEFKQHSGHAAEPWKTWSILANIESDDGNSAASADANGKAIICYLAYRRDGGENHDPPGRLCLAVTDRLLAGASTAAASLLYEHAALFEPGEFLSFIHALQAIVAGKRDRALADTPDLNYLMAAEILFLIETLEKAGK
ncbi:MAG TPA: hypothetical protein VK581_12000, partial [Chthoniobacterales bacterium]|nr:hypothetical protein [Chthoniobacterales bacterium]